MSSSISHRETDSARIRDSLEFSDIAVTSLQSSASVLDQDAMQTSRLWESVYNSQSSGGTDQYYNRSFSSGRVVFSVPSDYFESLSQRAMVETSTMDSVVSELLKIEEFYTHLLKEGRRPAEINEKVRQAMLQKISELKVNNN